MDDYYVVCVDFNFIVRMRIIWVDCDALIQIVAGCVIQEDF